MQINSRKPINYAALATFTTIFLPYISAIGGKIKDATIMPIKKHEPKKPSSNGVAQYISKSVIQFFKVYIES